MSVTRRAATPGARRAQLRHDQAGRATADAAPDKAAEKFRLPVFTFIDTPGAYPGTTPRSAASQTIGPQHLRDGAARSPDHLDHHRESGSGALAISVADQGADAAVLGLSVISPEGCLHPVETSERAATPPGARRHRAPPEGAGPGRQIVNRPVGAPIATTRRWLPAARWRRLAPAGRPRPTSWSSAAANASTATAASPTPRPMPRAVRG